MPEFLDLMSPANALALFKQTIKINLCAECIPTEKAQDRILAEDIHAPHPLPFFRRSTVDGYAVKSGDSYGASEGLPVYLSLVGEVTMGESAILSLAATQCALIHTGGMIPEGADAVVMVERTQLIPEEKIVEVYKAVGVGENVIQIGEDVNKGDVVMTKGTKLKTPEIGGLMALGITDIKAAIRPKVGIISSGDEIIDPHDNIRPGQVRDINSYTLASLVRKAGGEPLNYGIIPDTPNAFMKTAKQAKSECDIVIFTAGSSVSVRDLTAKTIQSLGTPGILVHGLNVRPGKPTILAVCDEIPFIGLPGNPVSALVIANLIVKPIIEQSLGVTMQDCIQGVSAKLTINLSSEAGREDWVPVRLEKANGQWLAEPVFGKSNLIFTLIRADGLIKIHPDANGIAAGETVQVELF